VLNEINHSEAVRFPLMNPAKPGKVLERVASGPDKVYVLVRGRRSEEHTSELQSH